MVGDACGIFFRVCAVLSCSVVSNSATPWTVAHQAPLLTRILQARILQWAAMPPPGHLPNRGIEPRAPILQVDSLLSEPLGKPQWCKNTGDWSCRHLRSNHGSDTSLSITCVACQSGMIVLGRALLQLLSCELNKLLFSQNTFFFFFLLKRMSDRGLRGRLVLQRKTVCCLYHMLCCLGFYGAILQLCKL